MMPSMISKTAKQSDKVYYLIGYEPSDPNRTQLEEHLRSRCAQRISSCEWMLKEEPGKTLDLYRTIGRFDVRGFFAQQLSKRYDWHKIVIQAQDFFARPKAG